jgi:hypothetical protein
MIFLILTRLGYDELVAHLGQPSSPIWVNAGVLSTSELAQLRQMGCEVTDFVHVIDIHNISALETAIDTVQQHHTGQRVWIEYVPNS